ncbi:MAG: agmatine deiminase family protein [Pseudomonadota bacterium]
MIGLSHRLPAEWEPQAALLLAWPFADGDWQPMLDVIRREYIALIETVLRYQPVLLLTQPGCNDAQSMLGQRNALRYIEAPYNDTWCRDYGPITLLHAQDQSEPPLALDFYFNGWGGRHDARLDNRVNSYLARHTSFTGYEFRQSLLELEGGAIDSNGNGLVLVNRHCMRSRLEHLTDEVMDLELRQWLGAEHILSIEQPPLPGDDTDGHIDTLARFSHPQRITFQSLRDADATTKLLGQLEALRNADGRAFELTALPCPDDLDVARPASYANFVLINDAVLVPQYGSRSDAEALRVLAELFPERTAEPIDARALISQGGGPHCACMQIPKVPV